MLSLGFQPIWTVHLLLYALALDLRPSVYTKMFARLFVIFVLGFPFVL